MSYPQYVTVMTPWGFFPVSDVYSVIPKWEESHAVTADVVYDDDAPNYYAIVADLGAAESSFTLSMRNTADPDNPIPPADTATVDSAIWQTEGWQETRPLQTTLVLDDDDVWTGDIKIGHPAPRAPVDRAPPVRQVLRRCSSARPSRTARTGWPTAPWRCDGE